MAENTVNLLNYNFLYHFYPVGQGLFTTGAIRRVDEIGRPRFLWVYDCGTLSSQKLVDDGISQLEIFTRNRKRIDLLVLSHFDHDHISGVCRLLGKFRVGTLMLPYMPLAQRLIVAFEEGIAPNDPLIAFYLNPVSYLLAQEKPEIERILFVMPSGESGPQYPSEALPPKEPDRDGGPDLDFKRIEPDDFGEVGSLQEAARSKGARVEFLAPGTSIKVTSCLWEFVPYNDDPCEPITQAFIEEVEAKRADLLSNGSDEALKELKKVYDDHFGASSENRNAISLFLYSGPIYEGWASSEMSETWSEMSGDRRIWLKRWRSLGHDAGASIRCSVVYSGDGYLDSNDRLQKLIHYLHVERIRRTGVFQVMHHGAQTNWHQGVAAAISPLHSVFSSDPERKKWMHPHGPVLSDFWRYGAVQVDKQVDFTVLGSLRK